MFPGHIFPRSKSNIRFQYLRKHYSVVSLANTEIKSSPHNESFRGTPLFTSGIKGSLCAEAAVVFPIFTLFVACILSIFGLLEKELYVEAKLKGVADAWSVQAYFTENDSYDMSELTGIVEDGMEIAEVSVLGEEKESEEDEIVLTFRYTYRFPVAFFGKQQVPVTQTFKKRKWTGYRYEKSQDGEEIVYVTPSGEVYHRNRNCTYLQTKLESISKAELVSARNPDGKIYYACEVCIYEGLELENYYIAKYGERYHSTPDCPALKRTVLEVPISQIGGRRACPKCGGVE